ncbi:AAA family ATPase [Georgenia ruanii]|nr:SMC family ATPase [Georgenia ruanii]MPV87735.1 AAA family ATPase [Georgenia ruanii]
MRIHRLTLQAIGPYPGRHTIDFDTLSAGGLFLLEGPTGAGKSTIIDAVVFALYGKVAGEHASDDRLHSDHAAPDVEPFVELTFSTGAGIYRVWRSPAFQRPKKRGGGFTQQNARAKLWRLPAVEDDAGEAVSAHVQEVGTELGRIVVLDRTQFTQTVVLPQGQFASFLRAKPEDRRAVLQDVFGTEVYERLQKQLAEMARTARADLERGSRQIQAATATFLRAAELDDDEREAAVTDGAPTASPRADLLAAADALDVPALTEGSAAVLAGVGALSARAAAAEEQARTAERTARERLDTVRTLAALLERRTALLAEQARLTEHDPHVSAAADRLGLARRAATTLAPLRAQAEAEAAAAAAQGALATALADAAAGPHADLLAATTDGADLAALRAAHEAATGEQGALAALVRVERELPTREVGIEATARSIAADAEALAEAEELLAARPAARTALAGRLTDARTDAAGLPAARDAARAAAAVLDAATAADTRAATLLEAEAVVDAAVRAAREAVDHEHAVRRRWVDGMAGELAGRLEDGQPCVVCGATEHPSPAATAPEHASAADVDAAAAARDAATTALERARTRVTALTEQIAGLRAAAHDRDVETARAELASAQEQVARCEAAATTARELEGELDAFDRHTAELSAALTEDRASLAARRERVAALREQLAADRDRCAAARGDAESVTARAEALEARAATATALLDARRAADGAARSRQQAQAQVARALADADLPDAAAARAAALAPAALDALEREVLDHHAARARVGAGLAEPAVAALTGGEEADVAGAEQAHRDAMTALATATRTASACAVRATHTATARAELLAAAGDHAAQAERTAPVLRTAALATAGEGTETATTLATYVLLRRFEDVVAAANDRLATMSDGRYTLERIDEKEGGQRSRRAGLGLQVRDHLTEAPRDPHTLSGGETFYVSLCLALGLADVVRAEAGGVELGTLFVDEGFGSLDPATLDAVMAELGRLRDGGRAVGIVSHVAELKDRIAERIEVRRLPSGASTLTVRA